MITMSDDADHMRMRKVLSTAVPISKTLLCESICTTQTPMTCKALPFFHVSVGRSSAPFPFGESSLKYLREPSRHVPETAQVGILIIFVNESSIS
jgi:hypothetical protein